MNGSQKNEKQTLDLNPALGWRGGTLQFIFIIIVPLTILLLVIAFGSITVHQNAMRLMVGERDERAVRTAAGALTAQINQRVAALQDLAGRVSGADSGELQDILTDSGHLLGDLDGGLAIFDQTGASLAAIGERPVLDRLNSELGLLSLIPPAAGQVFISRAFPGPEEGSVFVAISTFAPKPAGATQERVVLGIFSPEKLARNTLQAAFAGQGQTAVFLFDASERLLYHSGTPPLAGRPPDHPGMAEALGGQSGTRFLTGEDGEHAVAYTPVSPVNWALVADEPWEMGASPLLNYSLMAPLVLVPVLLFTLFALWFGVRQIVQPLQALEKEADALAWGDYQAVETPVGGIAEIRHLQKGLIQMAQKVRAAQQSLHGYIGAITAGQEDERRRLARELHDDTIQSLIALKQRVQLAQLNEPDGSASPAFSELEVLTEKTIDNLRRVTRALRPIYLEDLGLLAALEMLTREISQTGPTRVEMNTKGVEQRLSPKVELALYRIAQEALNNIIHHAKASQASVNLSFLSEEVVLEVKDNGKGFEVPKNPAEFAPHGHFGLLGLYERAELIGAKLGIESTREQGTQIIVRVVL